MTAPGRGRGSVPIGHLHALDAVEADAIHLLRRWCAGVEHQADMTRDLEQAMGAAAGRAALAALETLCDLCIRYARRPLMRRPIGCGCVGADESCFAALIGCAAEGARDDALMIAVAMVRPDAAPLLIGPAEDLGLALKQAAVRRRAAPLSHALH
ncbi:hypothetical protein DXV76_10945 [Rhodobacteraceae bacterium CCMM004]|nr:hypothetical protein DXV76_10945 [Rhodobacteraceae bacterium CCMM004]